MLTNRIQDFKPLFASPPLNTALTAHILLDFELLLTQSTQLVSYLSGFFKR